MVGEVNTTCGRYIFVFFAALQRVEVCFSSEQVDKARLRPAAATYKGCDRQLEECCSRTTVRRSTKHQFTTVNIQFHGQTVGCKYNITHSAVNVLL